MALHGVPRRPATAPLSDTSGMADAHAPTMAPRAAGPDRAATDRPLRELRGVVERITYQNAENGFTVARLAPERPESEAEAARGDDRLVTVVGTLADLTPGEAIVAHGWWRNARSTTSAFLREDQRTRSPP